MPEKTPHAPHAAGPPSTGGGEPHDPDAGPHGRGITPTDEQVRAHREAIAKRVVELSKLAKASVDAARRAEQEANRLRDELPRLPTLPPVAPPMLVRLTPQNPWL